MCLDWYFSNPNNPKTSNNNEVLTLQSMVPKVYFHWAWRGMRKMRLRVTDTDRTQTGDKPSQEILGDDLRWWPSVSKVTTGMNQSSEVNVGLTST